MTMTLPLYQTFRLGDELFGVHASQVLAAFTQEVPTVAPQPPGWEQDFMVGVIQVRDELVPLMDLRARLGRGPAAEPAETGGVVVMALASGAEPAHLGLRVDEVGPTRQVPIQAVEPGGVWLDFLIGQVELDGRQVTLLDVTRLLR